MAGVAAPAQGKAAIERLLRPRSVAIVGASPSPGALGASVLANLVRARYAGDIYLVNPKRTEIEGRPCLPSVDALPEGIDCAVLAIPRGAVLDTIEACGRRRIGSAVIFASGFAELGPHGRAEQEQLARIARAHGLMLEGPNCLGLVNHVDGIPLTFVETVVEPPSAPGIAVLSQSGAMAAVAGASLRSRAAGISFSVSTGNEATSGIEDYLEYLIDGPSTRIFILIVEQFRNPRRFLTLAQRACAAGKTVILLHPGRSSCARASAATHTGAIAGDHAIMLAKIRHAGVLAVDSLEELLDVSELAWRLPAAPSRGPAVMVESGWFKAQMLDMAEAIGLPLPNLTAEGDARLRAVMPDFIPATNPLDLTAQALVDPDLYHRTLSVLAGEECFGSVLMAIILTDEKTARLKLPPVIEAIRTLRSTRAVIFAQLDEGAPFPLEFVAALRALGVPFFPSAERAFRALAHLTNYGMHGAVPAVVSASTPLPPVTLPAGPCVIPEYKSKTLLAAIGLTVPPARLARDLAAARAAAAAIGYPVALKAQSPDLPHKSDIGGVVLNLADEAALVDGWAQLHANITRARPDLQLDGVLIEALQPSGIELIVGARNDPAWGPTVLVGFGGVLAELLKDSRLLPPDLPLAAIEHELLALGGASLLKGYRGGKPLDVAAAARLVAHVGQLVMAEPRIAEIDINPVLLYPSGQGAMALDALITLRA